MKNDVQLDTHDLLQRDFILCHEISNLIFGHKPISNSDTTIYIVHIVTYIFVSHILMVTKD